MISYFIPSATIATTIAAPVCVVVHTNSLANSAEKLAAHPRSTVIGAQLVDLVEDTEEEIEVGIVVRAHPVTHGVVCAFSGPTEGIRVSFSNGLEEESKLELLSGEGLCDGAEEVLADALATEE